MTIPFNKQDISRRFTGPDLLKPIVSRDSVRDELAAHMAEWEKQNSVTVLRGVVVTPKPDIPRKPHPESRQAVVLKRQRDEGIPPGLIPIGQAAVLCGMSQTNSNHLWHLRNAVECGKLQADHARTKGDKSIYYFQPETVKVFAQAAGEKWWLTIGNGKP